MHRTSIFLVATAAAVAITQPAGAQTPAATIAVDRPCYSPVEPIHWTGTGYTPNSVLDVVTRVGDQSAYLTDAAGPDGSLDVTADLTTEMADFLLPVGARSATAVSSAVAHGSDAAPADAPTTTFTISRWDVDFGRLRAGRAVRFTGYGFTHSVGETLYVHFVRGMRTVKTVKVGRLAGPCGDAARRIPHAAPKKAGTYKLYFSTSPTNAKAGDWFSTTARVRA